MVAGEEIGQAAAVGEAESIDAVFVNVVRVLQVRD